MIPMASDRFSSEGKLLHSRQASRYSTTRMSMTSMYSSATDLRSTSSPREGSNSLPMSVIYLYIRSSAMMRGMSSLMVPSMTDSDVAPGTPLRRISASIPESPARSTPLSP